MTPDVRSLISAPRTLNDHPNRRCSNCSGRGRVDDYSATGQECGACKGAGYVPKGSRFAIPFRTERQSCPTCNGSGSVTVWG